MRLDTRLPIYQRADEIADALRHHQVLVVAGETGSGKTTQLPLICLGAGRGTRGIACTQPRRIAATSIARHVARQLEVAPGSTVGHRVRFDQNVSDKTKVTFMTDGMLLSDIQHDRDLRRFDTIIIDEAHERSLNIDFLLGYLRRLLKRRRDLTLIVSSATIDTTLFSQAFGNAPIIEVSGRMYPVEVLYEPLELDEDGIGAHYIEAAVRSVEELLAASDSGDVLVFMPTQADITETVEMLSGRSLHGGPRIMPLYGRMPSGQQNRIFDTRGGRKVVVATNIAETSITVPNIRFVVDTGLARTVRYVPQQRTSRMPVEPISQASANQRSGRCGRVRDGTCVRLYSTEDFEARDAFTTPEIRRTNLANAVLQMHYMGLGAVEEFPFVQPPERRAVNDAYALLAELGALSRERELTPLGRRMAQLPLDPPIARMILRAAEEGALREVKVIAAGLSVVDPRERPTEKRAEADAAQKRFADPMSDFLTYLKLWDTYQGQWETLRTQNRMRRFCREHFLSFNRMREWHDVHRQIDELSRRSHHRREHARAADYDAIHRSLLSGLLHNVAMHVDKGEYRATRDRGVFIFPGSSLFRAGHPWIMCHEIVETTRVYCRTVAVIQPEWVEQLAPELCRRSYAAPHFDPDSGTVRALEQVTFHGLPVVRGREVAYGRVNPADAHTVFVMDALVGGALHTHQRFLGHNLRLRRQVEQMESKLRTRSLYLGDDAVAKFYTERIPEVTSVHDLNRAIRTHHGDGFLHMTLSDLLTVEAPPPMQLPDRLEIGGKRYPLAYRFEPGAEDDGICVSVPEADLGAIHTTAFEWALPSLWPRRVQSLLNHLPRSLRRHFVPLPESAKRIADSLTWSDAPFAQEVRRVGSALFRAVLPAEAFDTYEPELHAWVRVRILDEEGQPLYSFVPPERPSLPSFGGAGDAPDTETHVAFASIQRSGLTSWEMDELPERVESRTSGSAMPLFGFPALREDGETVSVVVCSSAEEARVTHERGLQALFGLALASDLAWEERDTVVEEHAALVCAPVAKRAALREQLCHMLKMHYLAPAEPHVRAREAFEQEAAAKRTQLRGAGHRLTALFSESMAGYAEAHALIRTRLGNALGPAVARRAQLEDDLGRYLRDVVRGECALSRLEQYPRYLRAFCRRIDNAHDDPGKYGQRREQLAVWEQQLARASGAGLAATVLEQLREALEEYAISLFAQQAVGTRFPVSEKRLRKSFDEAGA